MLERSKTFKGGYVFKRLRGTPTPRIEEAAYPQRVVIPLKEGLAEDVSPAVEVGQKVRAGQIIGQRETASCAPLLASVNGTVADIADIVYHDQKVKAVIIEADGTKDWARMGGAGADFENRDSDDLWQILYRAGVTSLIGISPSAKDVTDIVVNAIPCEPFALPSGALLSSRITAFMTGLKVLRRALSVVNIHVGIDKEERENIQEMDEVAHDWPWLRIYPLWTKYPQNHEAILVRTILGKEIPWESSAVDIGVVVVDVQTVLAAYEAVVEGKPLIERTVALGGSAFEENLALRVRVGTPLENIIRPRLRPGVDARIILGNILTQPPEQDLSIPVERTLSAIVALEENRQREFLSFMRTGLDMDSFSHAYLSSFLPLGYKRSDTNLHGELRPCIFCNYCEEVCPVGIIPHLLSNHVTHDQVDETPRFRIQACIECGLCSYVCPAKIPLMAHIQQGKQQIREEMEHDQAVATAS